MITGKQSTGYIQAQSGAADELRDAIASRRGLPDENPSAEQIEIYRRMSPGRRLELAEQM